MAILAGCGGLADFIKVQIVPMITGKADQDLVLALKYIAEVLNTVAYYCAPYCLLIFSISYTGLINFKKKYLSYLLNLMLFIPVLLMYANTTIYPFQISHIGLLIGVAPYFLASDFLLVLGVFAAQDQNIKRQRLLSCLLLAPLATALFFTNFVGLYFGIAGDSLWYLNDSIGILTLFGFIFLAAKYGVLGVKIEAVNIDNQMKIATLGTNIVNHAIKNEIAKIKISVKNILPYIETNKITSESIEIINDSFNHLSNMVSRIQEKTRTIELKEEPCNLASIINSTINAISPILQNRNIEIIRKVEPEIELLCDRVHLKEVLLNIFKNAVEAIPASEKGYIGVESKRMKKQMVLEIRDNGTGIPKEVLPHVFKPFFSTKHPTVNFGLGLSYSLNVLQKSGGTIEIQSDPNIGTIVLLKFPTSKLIHNLDHNNTPRRRLTLWSKKM